jgi:hypothetical protein
MWSSSLYACLGTAPNPWKLYENGSSIVETIQCITDLVYPCSGYRVRISDKIFSMEFEAADSIRKTLELVNQVCVFIFSTFLHLTVSLGRSPSHHKLESFFKSHVKRWMRWGLLYDFLDQILTLQQVCLWRASSCKPLDDVS